MSFSTAVCVCVRDLLWDLKEDDDTEGAPYELSLKISHWWLVNFIVGQSWLFFLSGVGVSLKVTTSLKSPSFSQHMHTFPQPTQREDLNIQ